MYLLKKIFEFRFIFKFFFEYSSDYSKIAGSGPDGSNDTSLKFVSGPGAEPIECQTHTHTQNTDIII